MRLLFNSRVWLVGHMREYDADEIKAEPMFFSSDVRYAMEHGGPITKSFLRAAPPAFLIHGVFDSRVHMLMGGWYPAIPGYHHDDIPRPSPQAQPNYIDPPYHARHVCALVNGAVAPTVFALGKLELELPTNDVIYRAWHPQIEAMTQDGRLQRFEVESGRLYEFDDQSFHAAQPARMGGWRWFGRISMNTKRPVVNEIRKQVQVYLDPINQGW